MNPTLNLQFFIEGRDYGRGKISRFPTQGTSDRQWHVAFNCQLCGRQWAQAVITDNSHPLPQWSFVRAICANHSSPNTVCGSLWKADLHDLIQAMPPEVLARELDLHLKYFDAFGHSLY